MVRPVAVLVAAFALACAASPLRADDWPTYRRDYSRSGATTETIAADLLGQLWTHDGGPPRPAWPAPARWDAFSKIPDLRSMRNYDPVYHVTAVGDACFHASSTDDSVRCLDALTGKIRWTFTTAGPVRIAPTWWEGHLYFGSDDGRAYCVAADTGKLVWSFAPTPEKRLVINDGRLISFQPVRTGVVVIDGTAYFGTSLLPWKQTYLCAVDAKTGKAEGEGRFVKQHDGLTLEGGLLISAKRLIAPQGRVAPLLFDRNNGTALGPLAGATGGCFMLVTDDDTAIVAAGRGKGQVTAGAITAAKPKVKTKIVSLPRGNAVVVRDERIWVLDDHLVTALNRKTLAKLWQKAVPHACELLLAGDALFVGGRDEVLAIEPETGAPLWQHRVHGRAFGLALANGKLFVSTDEGQIHCFASSGKPMKATAEAKPGPVEMIGAAKKPDLTLAEGPVLRFTAHDAAVIRWKTVHPSPTILEFGEGNDLKRYGKPAATTDHEVAIAGLRRGRLYRFRVKAKVDQVERVTDFMECDMHVNYLERPRRPVGLPFADDDAIRTKRVAALLDAAGHRQGFCLLITPSDPRLASDIAQQTKLRVVVVETDAKKAAAARAAYLDASLYGTPIAVHHVERLDESPLPPCFANIVIIDEADKAAAEDAFRYVRPEGGCLLTRPIPAAAEPLTAWAKAQRHDVQQVNVDGDWLCIKRGRLPGAADWMHQYGTPDNSGYAGEELADAAKTDDLELLWFGQPGPRFNVDRNPRKPAPLSANGQLFVQGLKRIAAIDAFNGTIQWTVELSRFVRYNIPHDCSNWCCDDAKLYLAIDDQCWRLSSADGAVKDVLRLDQVLPAEQALGQDWGFLAKVGDTIVGSAVRRGSHFLGFWGGDNWYDAKADHRYVCSDQLFAIDAQKKTRRWVRTQGVIINTTITVAENRVLFVESRNAAAVKNPTGRLGKELWNDLWLVALDLATGEEVWSRPLADIGGAAAFYLTQAEGRLIVTSSEKGKFNVRTFAAAKGEPGWVKNYPWEADHHGKHLSRPAVVGGRLILRPHVVELATGKESLRGFPAGHGCGSYCTTKNLVIFRGNEIVLWDVAHNASSRFNRLRPDCWISTIVANGMLLSPEGGGGCSCGNWMEMSAGFLPRAVR